VATRRAFLGRFAAGGAVAAAFRDGGLERVLAAGHSAAGLAPENAAADEDFWRDIQSAFSVDRTLINLNNGGVSPSPRVVQDALRRYLELSNEAPVYTMWQLLEPQIESVRKGLAAAFGCDPEELAITRNASESLETCILGIDLQKGDEVLTTNQDYPRMLTTWKQRARRDGIVLKQFSLPTPCEDPAVIVGLFEQHLTARTRIIHMCHVINLTGQILPVKAVVQMARAKGIPVIVDGAHSFGHIAFQHGDLDCDYFGTSLHKFLFAPHGTGMLYVRKERIPGLWPLMPAAESQDGDIRKFEEIGTHPAANFLAIADALTFHEALGPQRKEARQLYLRDRWAKRLAGQPRFRLHTSLEPGFATGVATVEIEGLDAQALAKHLWEQQRIFTTAIVFKNHEDRLEFQGLRVSPAVYNTLAEVDRFSEAMERIARNGLPG
jgi:selenocysteine lyase/cysteine desulfurase